MGNKQENNTADSYLQKLQDCIQCKHLGRMEKLLRHPLRSVTKKIMAKVLGRINKPLKIKGKTFWGEWMVLVGGGSVSQAILNEGFFEVGLTRMLLEYLHRDLVFFDVGAHFGYFTML